MKKIVEENQILKLIPQNINGAAISVIKEITENEIFVEIQKGDSSYFKENVEIEIYGLTVKGFLYFKTSITSINGNNLTVRIPQDYNILQRREHIRVAIDKAVKIKSNDVDYLIRLVDLSAGGLKFHTDNLVNIDFTYEIILNLGENLCVSCKFKTVKLETMIDGTYSVQGQFVGLENDDRMKISQFCQRKYLEDKNR